MPFYPKTLSSPKWALQVDIKLLGQAKTLNLKFKKNWWARTTVRSISPTYCHYLVQTQSQCKYILINFFTQAIY